MTPQERDDIRAIIEALGSERNRFGRLEPTPAARENVRKIWQRTNARHGGLDTADQCRMILQAMIGDPITDKVFGGAS